MDGILHNKLFLNRALAAVLAVTLPTISQVATRQSSPDLAERVFHGPKAAKRVSDASLPKETGEVIVRLQAGASVSDLARTHGMAALRLLQAQGWFVLKSDGSRRSGDILAELRGDPNVVVAGSNEHTNYKLAGFAPNDPYFMPNVPTSGWDGQWHLENNIGGTIDANVRPAWEKNWTGTNVVIGIVDDCLQKSHPDLSSNFTPSNSFDFGQNDTDPSPVNGSDQHGTSVAGVAGARGGNGIGVTGAAPLARLAGLRIDFVHQTTQQFIDATLFHSANGSESIKIKNHSYGYNVPFITTPLEKNALATSASQETIHVFSAGNERGNRAQDSNTLDLQSSPDAITVAALGEDGKFASYSSFGANVFVCAPSNSAGLPSITTTDVAGGNGYNPTIDTFPDQNYTTEFGGTSSAAPLVSGVLALAKQANANLSTRLAKHLLARSSKLVDSGDVTTAGGWITNGAGLKFNENYGFGCIDADSLVNNAQIYQGVTKLQTEVVGPVSVNQAIPDNSSTGLSQSFSISSHVPLEEVLLGINVTHTYRGDVEIWLQSPRGTSSRVKSTALGATPNSSDGVPNIHWTFTSNAFWGEDPAGTWTLVAKDLALGDTGSLDDFTFTARMGQMVLKDDAMFTDVSIPSEMIAGQTYAAGLVAHNKGYSTWSNPLWYMRSENPSANTTWGFSQTNLGTSDSIAPGFSKTFSLKVIAPMDAGTYNFQWRMRHSGYTSFGEPSQNVSINVSVLPDAARYLSISSLPASVTAGSSFPVTVSMKNVGTSSWVAGSGYHLKAITSSTKWGNPTVPLSSGDNIVRGANKAFTLNAVAPLAPGTYVFQWRMENGTTVFGDLTPGYKIKVVSP